MLKLAECYKVPYSDQLNEEYEINNNYIIANVNVDKQKKILEYFIDTIEEPIFFILEVPMTQSEENSLRKKDTIAFHKNVYYLDGCNKKQALSILNGAADILINDGLSSFGFASHRSNDEMMVAKYNILTLYSKHIERFVDFMNVHNIPYKDKIRTAWDTFDNEHCGQCSAYEKQGVSVYSLVEDLKKKGLYLAEVRTDE